MPGVACGPTADGTIDEMTDRIDHEPWYVTERLGTGPAALGLVHHGATDPGGAAAWETDDAVGVCYGAITANRSGYDDGPALVEAVLEDPTDVLPGLEGPFLLAVASADGERLVVATDKLATRPCYYGRTPAGVLVSSELKAVLAGVEDVTLDERAAGDLLSLGWVVGGKTLAAEASALRPASVLTVEDDDLAVERYWTPTFAVDPGTADEAAVAGVYREMVDGMAGSLSGDVGLFLSGGLDSRTLAAVLRERYGPFTTLTFDRNPSDGSNVEPARRVARHLGVPNELRWETPDGWGHLVPHAVDLVDGMASWSYYLNPSFAFDGLRDAVDVVLEACPQGELFGEQPEAYQLRTAESATDGLLETFARNGAAARLTTLDTDVRPSFAAEVEAEAAAGHTDGVAEEMLAVWLRNMPGNAHFRTKKVARSQVGMRIPYAHGPFLDAVSAVDLVDRRDHLPFTGGRIPEAFAPLKADVLEELDPALAAIPYERTRVPPSYPLAVGDATYVAKQLWWRFVSGRPGKKADWYRTDRAMRRAIDGWVDRAAERELFNGSALRRLRAEHHAGEANHLEAIAAATTLELWVQRYVD